MDRQKITSPIPLLRLVVKRFPMTQHILTKLFLKLSLTNLAQLSGQLSQYLKSLGGQASASGQPQSFNQSLKQSLKIGLGVVTVGLVIVTTSGMGHQETDWFWLYVVALLGGGFWAWAEVKQQQPTISTPQTPNRASLRQKLQVLQEKLHQLDDLEQRQQLTHQIERLNSQLGKTQFQIVLCGKGSTGKTAVLNALLGKAAGVTGVTSGTTQTSTPYAYPVVEQILEHLDSLAGGVAMPTKRQISLVDTPALQSHTLENIDIASPTIKLPQEFRQKALRNRLQNTVMPAAANADLLLFVIDSDLTATEYQALKYLAQHGKRIILVFNKIDCYLPGDRQAIIDKVTETVAAWVKPEDIVSVMAAPAPVRVRQYATVDQTKVLKEWLEPMPPDVTALKNRIEKILSDDWETLWCENLHQQIRQLEIDYQTLLHQQYRLVAEKVITRYQWLTAGALFANPIPVIDLIGGTAIQTKMLAELAQIYGQTLATNQAKAIGGILGQSLVQSGCVQLATNAITACLKTNTMTYAIGGTVQGMVGAYVCRVAALSFISYLEQCALLDPKLNDNQSPSFTTSFATAAAMKPSQRKTLQALCQQTYQGLQGEGFFTEFVAKCWAYRQTMPVNLS